MDDLVFKALADPTRRSILDRLRSGPATTGELCALHPAMSRFGVMDHLRVLHEANLVTAEREGRTRWNHLNPVPIREVYLRWVQPLAEASADELLGLQRVARDRAATTDVRDRRSRRTSSRTRTTTTGRSA
jgi:DNA-binding transcriptional ArsR family regulator